MELKKTDLLERLTEIESCYIISQMVAPERKGISSPLAHNRERLVDVIHQIGDSGFTGEELVDTWRKLPDVKHPQLIDGGQSVSEYLDELHRLGVLTKEGGRFFLRSY